MSRDGRERACPPRSRKETELKKTPGRLASPAPAPARPAAGPRAPEADESQNSHDLLFEFLQKKDPPRSSGPKRDTRLSSGSPRRRDCSPVLSHETRSSGPLSARRLSP